MALMEIAEVTLEQNFRPSCRAAEEEEAADYFSSRYHFHKCMGNNGHLAMTEWTY